VPALIDVGANIGPICIPALARGYVSRCLALEPERENFRLLRTNAILNGVDDRLDARRIAVGDQAGVAHITRSTSNYGDHRVARGANKEDPDAVPIVPLNAFATDYDGRNVILWMDIQGFEGFALTGASEFCKVGTPLVIEFCRADLLAMGSYDLLITILTSSGYTRFFDLNERAHPARTLTADALHELADSLEQRRTFTDLLFLPAAPPTRLHTVGVV
jgi:FkbM family methyltransferase